MADGFWENAEAAQKQMKKIKDLQKWVADYEELEGAVDEVKLSLEFLKEEIVTEAEVDEAYAKARKLLEDLELRNMSPSPRSMLRSSRSSSSLRALA